MISHGVQISILVDNFVETEKFSFISFMRQFTIELVGILNSPYIGDAS